ncbi:MAG: hypothetical protein K2J11_07470 [Oscillospiraceae bacterium]|nr:hypothetical protein [Oscillospiraceae bacterium]
MLRNLTSIRRYISARGLTSNRSARMSEAMSMRTQNKNKSSNVNVKNMDRYSNILGNSLLTSGTSASMSDYRVQAAKSMVTLSKTCENFDAAMKKELSSAGVPENISFEFDYDMNSGEAKITSISDEQYLDGVQSALNKAMKKVSLETVAGGSKILNGKMTEAYYPEVAEALKKCFGQDISELSVDRKGNILGMNRKMRDAVTSEMTDRSFDAQSRYGFPAKELASVVKRVVSDKSASKGVSHMSFKSGSLKTADGDISVGSKCASPSMKDTKTVLRAAVAGTPNSMEMWVKYGDLF